MSSFLQNPELCKKCGGVCCKESAGMYLPQDLITEEKTFEEVVRERLEAGDISITAKFYPSGFMSLKMNCLFTINPREEGKGKINIFEKQNPCSKLTEAGCIYSFKDRPTGCKKLIPKENNEECHSLLLMEYVERCYSEYQEFLQSIIVEESEFDTIDEVVLNRILAVGEPLKEAVKHKGFKKLTKEEHAMFNLIFNLAKTNNKIHYV